MYILMISRKRDVDWTLDIQACFEQEDRMYDRLKITLKNGQKKKIYFDITDFFGK